MSNRSRRPVAKTIAVRGEWSKFGGGMRGLGSGTQVVCEQSEERDPCNEAGIGAIQGDVRAKAWSVPSGCGHVDAGGALFWIGRDACGVESEHW